MSSGEDWVLQPVLQGLCKYESLKSGEVDLYDIARMNEALEASAENRRRVEEALRKGLNNG